jgi:hypothetical protein
MNRVSLLAREIAVNVQPLLKAWHVSETPIFANELFWSYRWSVLGIKVNETHHPILLN